MKLEVMAKAAGAIVAATAAVGGVAWKAGHEAAAPLEIRVNHIEEAHDRLQKQVTSAEVHARNADEVSRYQAKMFEAFMISNGMPETTERPNVYRLNADGGVEEDDL